MEEKINNSGLSYYRLKTDWVAEGEKGELNKTKTEELVLATSYTEAEKIAFAIAADQNRSKFGSISVEIIRTKINEVLFNNILEQDSKTIEGTICNFFSEDEATGVGLYSVKVVFIDINEKSGKEKKTTNTIYVPATSNADATKRIDDYLKSSMQDYVIRDTKFDKSEAIYWPTDVQESKFNEAQNY